MCFKLFRFHSTTVCVITKLFQRGNVNWLRILSVIVHFLEKKGERGKYMCFKLF